MSMMIADAMEPGISLSTDFLLKKQWIYYTTVSKKGRRKILEKHTEGYSIIR